MKNVRRGLGRGMGMGYKNIVPIDGHIHSLSAKGVKTKKSQKKLKAIGVKGSAQLYTPSETIKSLYNLPPSNLRMYAKIVKQHTPEKIFSMARDIQEDIEPFSKRFEFGGSIRRKKLNPNDIDVVIIPQNKEILKEKILSIADEVRVSGDKQIFITKNGINIDFYFADENDFGSQLLTRTGSAGYNIGLRLKAKRLGFKLNQYGLFKDGKKVAGKTEESIGKALGKPLRLPELRAKGLKFSEYTKHNFNIDKKNILNSKEKYNGDNVFNFMYNPRTGEMLLGARDPHSDLLRSRDNLTKERSNFYEWVRGKYDDVKKILFVRHYFNPQSLYSEFTSKDFEISEKMQKKMIDVLKKKGLPKNIDVRYNQTNELLKQEGYIYRFEV